MANFKYELTGLSNTHNAIADWLIANPGKGQMGKCAAVFEMSRSWLSTLIHQDAFQAMMKHKQGKAFEIVIIPLHEKMSGVAHAGVEKLGEIIETSNDDRLTREITKDMLTAMGYGGNAKAAVHIDASTHNTLTVNQDALAAARELRSKQHGAKALESPSPSEVPAIEAQTTQLPHHQEPAVGEASELRAGHVNSPPKVYGDEEAGGDV